MRIGICDDNLQDQEAIKSALLPLLSNNEELICTIHGAELLEEHYKRPFDILFLDIGMPHLNGVAVAKELRRSSYFTQIIFVTQYRDYAAESYAVGAMSYLLKPLVENQVQQIFQQAKRSRLAAGKQLPILINYETVFLPIPSIIYAESRNNDIQLHTYSGLFHTRMSMRNLSVLLVDQGFYRLHNSYLVNLACVQVIKQRMVQVDGGDLLPIGKTRRVADIKAALLEWRGYPL